MIEIELHILVNERPSEIDAVLAEIDEVLFHHARYDIESTAGWMVRDTTRMYFERDLAS